MSLPRSDEEVLLLHNPRCSKSRATLALLEENGIAFIERRYLEDPLTREELADLGARLGRSAGEWIRTKETEYSEVGLDDGAPEGAVLDAIAAHPVLMERPIVVRGKSAKIGRPPEDVLQLFD